MPASSQSNSAVSSSPVDSPPTQLSPAISDRVGLAHDARNLLGALSLYSDLLALPGVLDPKDLHYSEELRGMGERSAAMIDRLLAYDPVPEPGTGHGISLPTVLDQCSGLLTAMAGPHVSVEIEIAPGVDAMIVPITQESFERILINLVRNASASMAHNIHPCYLHIALKPGLCGSKIRTPHCLFLSVSDTGRGMNAHTVASLLHPSVTIDSGPRGIGMRVVRELTQLSGGTLSITSTLGSGSCFQIEWRVGHQSAADSSHDLTASRATIAPSQACEEQPQEIGQPSAPSGAPRPHSMQAAAIGAGGRILC